MKIKNDIVQINWLVEMDEAKQHQNNGYDKRKHITILLINVQIQQRHLVSPLPWEIRYNPFTKYRNMHFLKMSVVLSKM